MVRNVSHKVRPRLKVITGTPYTFSNPIYRPDASSRHHKKNGNVRELSDNASPSFVVRPPSSMAKHELFALAVIALIFIAFPALLFGIQWVKTNTSNARVVTLTAHAPDAGGWQPDTIRINVGERVILRVASADVAHTFAVPALGIESGNILPGHVQDIEFVATQTGRFAFACTRWCSLDHWRMRGTIEVVDPSDSNAALTTPAAPPLYQQFGINLDAMRHPHNVPPDKPSAERGAALHFTLPADLQDRTAIRALAPNDLFTRLRDDATFDGYTDAQLWDVVALSWKNQADDSSRARGEKLYARDCTACHGEAGRGDGRAGKDLPGLAAMDPTLKRGPQDFTDASQMLTASDVLLQGKLLRGGMGTGMPEFGSLYGEQDMWDVIAFLRLFTFQYD